MKIRILLAIMMVVGACEEQLVEKPENLIPKDKMISMLYDIAVLNAAAEISSDVLLEHDIDPSAFVLEQYGVDSVLFAKSDLYYASLPKEYDAIYAAVKGRLDKEKERLDKIRQQQGDSARQQIINREPKNIN